MFHCVGSMGLENFYYSALLEKLETRIHQRYQTQFLSGARSVSFSPALIAYRHGVKCGLEVWLTFLPLVSCIFGVSGLIDPSVVLLFYLFFSALNSVQSWHWDILWVWREHSTSETFSLFHACFHLPLLERKCSSTCSPALEPWEGVAHFPLVAAHSCPGCSHAQGEQGPAEQQLVAGSCCCSAAHSRASHAASHNQNLPEGGKNPQLCISATGNKPRMGNHVALLHCWFFIFYFF